MICHVLLISRLYFYLMYKVVIPLFEMSSKFEIGDFLQMFFFYLLFKVQKFSDSENAFDR